MQYHEARRIVLEYQQAHKIGLWFTAFEDLRSAEIKTIEQSRAVAVIEENFRRLCDPNLLYRNAS